MAFTATKKKMLADMPAEERAKFLRMEKLERRLAKLRSIDLTATYNLCYQQMTDFQRRR